MKLWNSTIMSRVQSNTRHARLPQRAAIQDALSWDGSNRKCMMLKCASASTNNITPVTRMRYQTNSSKPLPWGRLRPAVRGSIITIVPPPMPRYPGSAR